MFNQRFTKDVKKDIQAFILKASTALNEAIIVFSHYINNTVPPTKAIKKEIETLNKVPKVLKSLEQVKKELSFVSISIQVVFNSESNTELEIDPDIKESGIYSMLNSGCSMINVIGEIFINFPNTGIAALGENKYQEVIEYDTLSTIHIRRLNYNVVSESNNSELIQGIEKFSKLSIETLCGILDELSKVHEGLIGLTDPIVEEDFLKNSAENFSADNISESRENIIDKNDPLKNGPDLSNN